MKENSTQSVKIISENRKARHDYEFMDTFEAGLTLLGWEVKSLREGGVNLRDSYIREISGELYLVGCHITPYKFGRREEMPETRDRKLLMHKQELRKIIQQSVQKGLTMVPTKLYFKGARVKLGFALARGKKLFDKREATRKRETERALSRLGD